MTPEEVIGIMEKYKKDLEETVLPLYENNEVIKGVELFKIAKMDLDIFMTRHFVSEHFNKNLYDIKKSDVENLISYISNLVAGFNKGDKIDFK